MTTPHLKNNRFLPISAYRRLQFSGLSDVGDTDRRLSLTKLRLWLRDINRPRSDVGDRNVDAPLHRCSMLGDGILATRRWAVCPLRRSTGRAGKPRSSETHGRARTDVRTKSGGERETVYLLNIISEERADRRIDSTERTGRKQQHSGRGELIDCRIRGPGAKILEVRTRTTAHGSRVKTNK